MLDRFNFKYYPEDPDNIGATYTAIKINESVYVVVWKEEGYAEGYDSVIYSAKEVKKYIYKNGWIIQ